MIRVHELCNFTAFSEYPRGCINSSDHQLKYGMYVHRHNTLYGFLFDLGLMDDEIANFNQA